MSAISETAGIERSEQDEALGDIIDLARYPLHAPGSPAYGRLVDAARQGLGEAGACVLAGFMRPAAVARTLAEVDPLQPEAFVCRQPHNVYLVDPDPARPSEHARNRLVRSEKAILAHDEIPTGSPLRGIYESPGFRAFICDALEVERLFPFDDPLASINVNFYGEDQELGWHFDNAKFALTLMLRQAVSGGAFEYAPNIRTEDEAGYGRIARILDGDATGVRELKQDPGALVLFKGSRSLHRVAPSFGSPPRTIAILSYAGEPGQGLKDHTRLLFYGRRQ
jgi:hypothetical protein